MNVSNVTQTVDFPKSALPNAPTNTDQVSLTLSLDSVLFDMLVAQAPEQKLPIKIALHQSWVSDLAHRLSKKKITLTDKEMETLRELLDNDLKWQEIKVHAEISRDTIEINSQGLSMFTDIMEALTSFFI